MQRIDELLDAAIDVVSEASAVVRRTQAAIRSVSRARRTRPDRGPGPAPEAEPATENEPAPPKKDGPLLATEEGPSLRPEEGSRATAREESRPLASMNAPPPHPPAPASDAVPSPTPASVRAQAILNGMWGDRLDRRASPLAVEMSLRHRGLPVPLEPSAVAAVVQPPTTQVAVFVHGWSCTEAVWVGPGEGPGNAPPTFGQHLRADLGYTPLYVRYNTGRHVSENGRSLSRLLQRLSEIYPLPIEELVLVGHSMGGLVVRSAAHHGDEAGATWLNALRHVFCLGSPHAGSTLEQGTQLLTSLLGAVPTPLARAWTDILETRSSGIKDLRFGYTRDEEWRDLDPDEVFTDGRLEPHLVEGVAYHFAAATLTRSPHSPWGRLVGDVFVRTASAAGGDRIRTRRIPFRSGRIIGGLHHFALARHPEVYAGIRAALDPRGSEATPED